MPSPPVRRRLRIVSGLLDRIPLASARRRVGLGPRSGTVAPTAALKPLSELSQQEAVLAQALLPPEPPNTDGLTSRDQFLTHAYLVLAHAVIEEFVEHCFLAYVDAAVESCTSTRVPGCFLPLSVRFASEYTGTKLSVPSIAEDHAKGLRGLYSWNVVNSNNGIKKANLLALARPLGLVERLESTCDPLFGPAERLGRARGKVAHVGTVSEELRPAAARELVTAMVTEMQPLVQLLTP